MTLAYLLFDYSEGEDDSGLFDAMADVPLARAADVQAEVDEVLAWAERHFGHARGPLEDGGEWDVDLQLHAEGGRRCFSLSVVGTPAFCDAFRARFGTAVN